MGAIRHAVGGMGKELAVRLGASGADGLLGAGRLTARVSQGLAVVEELFSLFAADTGLGVGGGGVTGRIGGQERRGDDLAVKVMRGVNEKHLGQLAVGFFQVDGLPFLFGTVEQHHAERRAVEGVGAYGGQAAGEDEGFQLSAEGEGRCPDLGKGRGEAHAL